MKRGGSYLDLVIEQLKREEGEVRVERLNSLFNDKNTLIQCLYALKILYEDLYLPFQEFKREYETKSNEEIRMELDDLIRCYNKSRSLKDWRDEIICLFYAKRLKLGLDLESPMTSPREVLSVIELLRYISNYFRERYLVFFF